MLQIQNLTLTAVKDGRVLLSDFSFVLRPGDKAVIIGEEGNGKSTLLRVIAGVETDYVSAAGRIIRDGLRLGYLKQELAPAEKEETVYSFCCLSDAFFDLSPGELSGAAVQLGLKPEFFYSDQPVKTLSGGEKVKLQIARLLFDRSDVLLLDEPSNDIDIETLCWLEQFIRESPVPVLFVSHDETLIENTANVVIHLEQLRRKTLPKATVSRTGYRAYSEARLNQLTHQEQVARKERDEYDKQMERWRQIYQKVDHEQAAISRQDPHGGRLLKKKMKAVQSLGRRFEREKENLTEMPDAEEAIMLRFDEGITLPNKGVLDLSLPSLSVGGRLLSQNIRLVVCGPEHICITGRNGAGKTTLLRQIAGELLARKDLKAAYMPQDYEDLLALEKTPVDFLAPSGDKESVTRARTFLGSVKYTAEEMLHPAAALSGGQKAKLLLLKMIFDGAEVLALDEPTRNFSPLSNPVIREVLKSYGGAIISVSHDRKYIAEVCDTVYLLTETGLSKERSADGV